MPRLNASVRAIRADLPERVVQFGSGRLIRGFCDAFFDAANADDACPWTGRVAVVQSTGGGRSDAFREQDGLFTILVRGVDEGREVNEPRVISSVSRAVSAVDDWPACLALARLPELELIVSNTTEVGIRFNPDDRPDGAAPKSFPAKLTVFLRERFRAFGGDPAAAPVVIPCELIENNADALRSIVLNTADRWDLEPGFRAWLAEHVRFCNSLVDRICTMPEDPAAEASRLGYEDDLLTVVEPYRLWAIQGDEEIRRRLPWATVDPQIVIAEDISPFRQRKLRILNGSHTASVPAAFLAGHALVIDMMRDPVTAQFVEGVAMREIVPSLEADGVADAEAFARQVFDRFRNPYLRHQLIDIAFQCTSKVHHRLIPSIRAYHRSTGRLPGRLCLALAAWLRFSRGEQLRGGGIQGDFEGRTYPINDEHAGKLMDHWSGVRSSDEQAVRSLAHAVLADRLLWTEDLTVSIPGLDDAVADRLLRIARDGIRSAIRAENEAAG